MATCAHCSQDEINLITVGGHEVCRPCLETLSAEVGTKERRKLSRKRGGKQIAGVCAGIADHVEVDRDTVRVGVILLCVFTAFIPCLIGYSILTYILPVED